MGLTEALPWTGPCPMGPGGTRFQERMCCECVGLPQVPGRPVPRGRAPSLRVEGCQDHAGPKLRRS